MPKKTKQHMRYGGKCRTRRRKNSIYKKRKYNKTLKLQKGGCFSDLRIIWGNLWNNNPAGKYGNRYLIN